MKNYLQPSWEDMRKILEKEGFVEIKFPENWYVFMQKGPKNIRIPKLNKIPTTCLESIVEESEIDTKKISDFLKNKNQKN